MMHQESDESIPKICLQQEGLAIYIAFASSCLLIFRSIIPQDYIWPIILAGGMVVLTGLIDDIKEITQ